MKGHHAQPPSRTRDFGTALWGRVGPSPSATFLALCQGLGEGRLAFSAWCG